jgi:hypothetical protein
MGTLIILLLAVAFGGILFYMANEKKDEPFKVSEEEKVRYPAPGLPAGESQKGGWEGLSENAIISYLNKLSAMQLMELDDSFIEEGYTFDFSGRDCLISMTSLRLHVKKGIIKGYDCTYTTYDNDAYIQAEGELVYQFAHPKSLLGTV